MPLLQVTFIHKKAIKEEKNAENETEKTRQRFFLGSLVGSQHKSEESRHFSSMTIIWLRLKIYENYYFPPHADAVECWLLLL